MKEVYVTWEEFDCSVKLLAEKIRQSKEVTVNEIYGIPRGGLMISVRLSHLLSLPFIQLFPSKKDTLIVDDVIDTGKTLEHRYYEGYKTASLYWCKKSSFKPNIYVNQKLKSQWIIFPWECKGKV